MPQIQVIFYQEDEIIAPVWDWLAQLARMFHEADFAGSLLFRGLYFVDLARV